MAKAGLDANNDPSKMFSADVIAAVLAASGTTSLSMKQYEMMSAVDGKRTASGFQHAFRAIIAKSKELKTRVDNGEVFVPVPPSTKRGPTGGAATPATPKKRKAVSSDDEGTPSKKKKKSSAKKKAPAPTPESPTDSLGADANGLPLDIDEFIKREREWNGNDGYV